MLVKFINWNRFGPFNNIGLLQQCLVQAGSAASDGGEHTENTDRSWKTKTHHKAEFEVNFWLNQDPLNFVRTAENKTVKQQ